MNCEEHTKGFRQTKHFNKALTSALVNWGCRSEYSDFGILVFGESESSLSQFVFSHEWRKNK